ncbi:DUF4258 domain-containing protein [Flavobacterium caeni]|uniref:DUF4258 domain-containing protein n=1 Tax=Flavobacterium caeni TaxID=490189 RepID=A0A1G5CZC3_9FLAO|nr:DUF4258 domain-containing protein [Flavobacterium caeni]SCY07742.1 protein of unknown function [Flavobacterium caeni]
MTFKYRFAYYMGGFIIGMFFVTLMWSGKDTRCNYFPNARVLNDLRNKPFHYSPEASAVLAQPWIDTVDIKNTLKHGDVDFDRSNKPVGGGKLYTVEGKTMQQQPIELELVNYSERVLLKNIVKK